MADPRDEVVSGLNRLIEACKDREQGYRTAAGAAGNQDLKAMLHSYEEQSAQYAAELQAEVKRLGGTPAGTGSVAGWLTRGWQHLTSIVGGGADTAVIAGCQRGEDAAAAAYDAALAGPLPDEVRAVLQPQQAGVKSAQDRLRALEAVGLKPA